MANIYTQSNETENKIINFRQNTNGTLTEVERVSTGGKGTNGHSISTGEEFVPDSLLSSNSIVVSKDKKYLFNVNAGNNTVSCFQIESEGNLKLMNTESTGNAVIGKSGTASSLAYNEADQILYVCHSFGPDHIKAFKVSGGMLILTDETQSVNLPDLVDRIPTQIVMSPDNKFLLACVLFDARPSEAGLTPAKEKNLIVFQVEKGGVLREPVFNEAGGVAPFASCFLNNSNTMFITVLAAESSAVISSLSADGKVMSSKQAKIDTMINGKTAEPSEICWLSLSEDNKYAFGANFGYGTVSLFEVGNEGLRVAMSQAAKEEGDGMNMGLAGVLSSGAGDNVVLGNFLYQLYANAKKLVGYKIETDGKLTKITETAVPYNSAQGIAKI